MTTDSLEELRNAWRQVAETDGGCCPVCDRWGMVYARILNRTMVKSLIWLCKEQMATGKNWIDIPNTAPRFVIRSNQLPVLTSWGLVERCPKDSAEGGARYSGLWRPTPKGYEFYRGQIKVPKKAFAYNNKVEGYSDDLVYIHECFDTFFNYQEVMGRTFSAYDED
jgi:hypothetical protein